MGVMVTSASPSKAMRDRESSALYAMNGHVPQYVPSYPVDDPDDLTREQFAPDEVLQEPRVVEPPPGLPHRCAAQYLRLRASVCAALGVRG